MDYGAEYTERQRRILYRRLRRKYREAQKNLEKKLKDFLAGSAAREKLYEKKVEAGLLTQSWFDNWKQGQVFIGKRWDAKLDEVTGTLTEANQKALAMIRGEQYKVFAENSNYQSYILEKDGQKHNAGISFDIYDETTVRRLIQEKPELLKRSTWKSRKDKAWNQGIISNSIAQGIIQGESIPKIAERIARDTCDRNNTHMMLYARTAMTCAQNSGRIETMHRATDMGLHVKKEWIATLDSRTRDSHQHLDGQTAEVDEPFSSILGDIMFPGDPDAEPANVWNCRCTLGSVYVDYESDGNGKRRDQETGEEIDDMTYDEWKEWKEEEQEKQEGRITERQYEREVQRYDDEIAALRKKRQELFDSETYDKAETDKLLDEIFALEDQKVDFISAYHFTDGDIELTNKLRSGKMTEISDGVNKVLDRKANEYKLRATKWNGKTVTINDHSSRGVAKWTGELGIDPSAERDLKVYIHEHLHFRSIHTLPNGKTLYQIPFVRKTEEGTVELYAQAIANKAGIPFTGSYGNYVSAIRTIQQATAASMDEFSFARQLFAVPPGKRLEFLEKKVKSFSKSNGNKELFQSLEDALNVLR